MTPCFKVDLESCFYKNDRSNTLDPNHKRTMPSLSINTSQQIINRFFKIMELNMELNSFGLTARSLGSY